MSMRKIILPLLLLFAAPVYGADICQQTFTFRLEKGSALTHQEGDDNFRNTKDVCDWLDGVTTCSVSGEVLRGYASDGSPVCTGNSNTATALAADPADCSAGNAAQGIAASGVAAGCFDVATQAELEALVTSADDLSDNTLDDLGNVTETGEGTGRPLVGDGSGGWAPAAAAGCLADGTNCPADDDNPESGDFGAAVDLEADGSLSADVVAAAEMADADHGDVSWSGGAATVDSGAVGLAEIADDAGCTPSQSVRRNAGDTAYECYTPSAAGVAGSDTQVQFNDGGAFGGDAGMVYAKTTDTLTVGKVVVDNLALDANTISATGNINLTPSGGDVISGRVFISTVGAQAFVAGTNVSTYKVGLVDTGGGRVRLTSDGQTTWSNTNTNAHDSVTIDTGIGRAAAGVVKTTDASTGIGKLLTALLVEANTAGSGTPNALAATESHTLLTNEGASALNYHTLPTAVAGYTFTFLVQDADGIRVVANTGDTIQVAADVSASAGYCESTTIGDSATFAAVNATQWVATALVGAGWSCT